MSDLTSSQQAAVDHFEGPLLVLAGPGSGKTRVITRRIARLVERGVAPREILAITFTNKAAAEMAARVDALLPASHIWVSTFHRFCARLLRQRAASVGLQTNYTIFDDADQTAVMRQVLADLNYDATTYSPRRLLHRIGRLKNEMVMAEDYARSRDERAGDHVDAVLAKVYPAYQAALLSNNAVDFDDLLLHVVRLLHDNDDLRADFDRRYRFVLVDEYQDTNLAQYSIVKALSQLQPNLCVTGDPDQSIYGWRGAQIENILRFERDYAGTKVVRLEENFRSTGSILAAADELIAHNIHRKAKQLRTTSESGPGVRRATFRDARHEADGIAREIAQAVGNGERRFDDYAIFYRVNALSRELEFGLTRQRVPYQIASGVSFYDRTEIKDLLAYLRVLSNPADTVAFRRIINKPKRGIGDTSQRRLLGFAAEQGLTPLEAAARASGVPQLSKAAVKQLNNFAQIMETCTEFLAGPVSILLSKLITATKYNDQFIETLEDDLQRLANVNELVNAASQYDREHGEDGSLEGFLETVSLTAEVDNIAVDAGRVTLMTLHAAKGLEFPYVYVVGVEHNLLPHERAVSSGDLRELEEERRLLFVGVTRAERELTLTHAVKRESRGRALPAIVSEFLFEMTLEHADFTEGTAGRLANRPLRTFADEEDWSQEVAEPEAEGVPQEASESQQSPTASQLPSAADGRAGEKPQLSALNLTTAADLLRGQATEAALPQAFGIGQKVRHPRYGTGTVLAADGFARNRRITVEFDDDRSRKTFVAAKCPLQPIGTG